MTDYRFDQDHARMPKQSQFTDQMGATIVLDGVPERIVSLVPSQTEYLFALGLDSEMVGVTRYCVYPREKVGTKRIVGGTKEFDFKVIDELEPNLIIGNKEENYLEGIDRLREDYPVWISDVYTLLDAISMMRTLGAIVGRDSEANAMTEEIARRFAALPRWPRLRAAYLIWHRPYLVAGHGTFAHEMLAHAGFTNAFGHLRRYPEVTAAQIRRAKPDLLLLSSEPFPFSQRHIPHFTERFPDIPCILVDGKMFTWYGSRLLQAPEYFSELHAELSDLEIALPLPITPSEKKDKGASPKA
jgi:ABC-type Fe3+-hydroxamate transport system substrate-binding protein